MERDTENEATVRTLLAAGGLAIPDDEVERLARLYPGLRQSVDHYHHVPVGDEVMAAVFRPAEQHPEAPRGGDRR